MIHALYTTALLGLLAGYAPVALARAARGRPLNLRARLGLDAASVRPARPSIWVHAVSVGEAIAAAPIVQALRQRYPELPLVVTTVTDTGARVVRERYAGLATHRFFPLDLPGAVRRVADAIDPAFLVCMETEIWPNVLRELARRGVPVMIANGRLSDRSYRRYRLVRRPLARVLADVRVFGMRSEEDARRMLRLGAPAGRVFVTGNVKNEAPADAAGALELWRRLLGLTPAQRVWIAGSTHRGEEAAALDAHAAARRTCEDLVLVLAPRHPERVPEVCALVKARGWPVVRRSALPRDRTREAVIVLDTVGELAQLYSIADVVFVGGSLIPTGGGHNMLEPAARRRAVLFGPFTSNFRESAALLLDGGGAMLVRDGAGLTAALQRLLDDPALRDGLGEAGHEAVVSRQGAVRETLELIDRFLVKGVSKGSIA
ncbi:MAG: 3-deoxy-D-manno-octulosonic acid transferase [Candidatus Rokubacteria bacterium]|nr:3-deoxy-D-manno-octulosonic acid transferase [Candidatus Rokubacteria bacterium]MBI3827752.1 3-deoxy-D-manno-octulosonic acid transferase [Candidatus Rokubacteria bacterium]